MRKSVPTFYTRLLLATAVATAVWPRHSAEAAFMGSLERVSPAPEVFTELADFRAFNDDGFAATGAAMGLLEAIPNFGGVPADYAGFTPGNIALVERGDYPFGTKVHTAMAAGASGVLIYWNNSEPLPTATLSFDPGEATTIPALLITQSLGQELLSQLAFGPVEVRLSVQPVPEPCTFALAAFGFAGISIYCRQRPKRIGRV